jgi:hypothetical protein
VNRLHLIVFTLLALGASLPCAATQDEDQVIRVLQVSSRDALQRAVLAAKPGMRIEIAPGRYAGGLTIRGIQGKESQPIVITAADTKDPPIFEGGGSGVHLSNVAHLELRYLTFTHARDNGLNIDDGGSFETPTHHLVLHGLTVRNVGPPGNRDGIKLSGVDDFRVHACSVERWGKAGSAIDMVGCHRGVIEQCSFQHEQAESASGVQAKGGSTQIVVRHCRFRDAGARSVNIGGSTGMAYFRPRPQGYEAKDITVEDCFFIGSQSPIAFVGVDGALVQNNVIYHPRRWVLRILQETQAEGFVPCRNGLFRRNIIVYGSGEISRLVNIGSGTEPTSFRFQENFWYCADRQNHVQNVRRELPTPETDGRYGADPQFTDPRKGDFSLAQRSPARGFGPRPADD